MSRIAHTISPLLAAALALGCASSEEELKFQDGLYRVRSRLTTPRGLPTQDSAELDAFVDLADHPDAFGGWLLERVEAELESPWSTALTAARQGLDADQEFQTYLEEQSPESIERIVALAADIKSVTSQLKLSSELRLSMSQPTDEDGIAMHDVTGVTFELATEDLPYELADMGIAPMSTARPDFRLHRLDNDNDLEWISFGNQEWLLPYGQILDYALNTVIVERHDPFASSLEELLVESMPCRPAGDWAETKTDIPDELFAVACYAAMDRVFARLIPVDLASIEGTLRVAGDAQLVDANEDFEVDGFDQGEWEGSLELPERTIRLTRPYQTFSGTRTRNVRDDDDDVN